MLATVSVVMATTSDTNSEEEEELFNMENAKEGTNLLSSPNTENESAPPYPKSVFFIVGNEFCERFSYYGMRTILVIYLTHYLAFSGDESTAIYHGFIMLCYFMPLFGAMIADGGWGKYKTILYLSMLYCVGNAVVSLTALPPPEKVGPLIGLLLIGIGTGGIKPCVAAFGGDQFSDTQEKQQVQFFSIFYFAINAGSLISTLLTPILREDVRCFGGPCYPLAFGIPAALMVVSLLLFVCGRKGYKVTPPTGNIIAQMFGCIWRAISNKIQSTEKRAHWLDYAEDKYDPSFIEDVRAVLRVLFLFIPLPFFWALFDQQGSRWTLQAVEMDGSLGALGRLYPDQMQALNPIGIILLIPLFESLVYPLFNKCKCLNSPLQRMVAGMVLAVVSFIIAGFLQLHLQATDVKPLDTGDSGLRFVNAANCPIHLQSSFRNETIPLLHDSGVIKLPQGIYRSFMSCSDNPGVTGSSQVTLQKGQGFYVIVARKQDKLSTLVVDHHTEKAGQGSSLVRFISVLSDAGALTLTLTLKEQSGTQIYVFQLNSLTATNFTLIEPAEYDVYINTSAANQFKLSDHVTTKPGAVYTIILQEDLMNSTMYQMVTYVDVPANTVSMLWQIPQYVVITVGEILFSISGLSFVYSQAPVTMKSILQAAWLMTVAFGSLIVVIIASAQLITNQAIEFFVFAGMMGLTTLIFMIMTLFYTYVDGHKRAYEMPEQSDTAGIVGNMKDPADTFSADDESGI